MSESGLLVTQLDDVTIVTFRKTSILDSIAVEAIADELYKLVDKEARRKTLLNFSAVRFLSSQMLSVLLNLHQKAGDIGGKVVICAMRDELKRIFKIMNLHKVLHFADGESEATSMLNERT